MNSTIIAVVACGSKKIHGVHRARDLYTGAYFRLCLRYALSRFRSERIYILSAKYGLIGIDEKIGSYDIKMGEPGSVTVAKVTAQAMDRGLSRLMVIAIGGKRYVDICRQVWPLTFSPLKNGGRMGLQMKWLKENTRQDV